MKQQNRLLIDSIDWGFITVKEIREARRIIEGVRYLTRNPEDPRVTEILQRLKERAEERRKEVSYESYEG